jgi:peptidyl-prolyl cis-trans isomerase A (cyclophilin A)
MTPRTALLALLLAAAAARAQTSAPPPAAASDLPDAPSAANAPKPEPVATNPTIVIDTTLGRLTCKTFPQVAPAAVANFIGLAEGTKDWTLNATSEKQHGKRFYDGLTFHRVIPGFMVQAGDPVGDGTGDAGFYFPDEISPTLTFSVPGRLALANSGPNTNSSQFFITEAPQPDLDGRYTIFGQCDAASVSLTASIARVPRNSADKPLTPVLITHVTILRDGQAMPPLPAPPPSPTPSTVPPTPPTVP